jgi:hypothetical protein
MREERFAIAQPVWDLQEMLRLLSFADPALPRLIPNGVFGADTLEAVMLFQRDYAPPVTGVVDQGTWDAIVEQSALVRQRLSPPRKVSGLRDRNSRVGVGACSPELYLVQAIFLALSALFEGVAGEPVTGVNSPGTAANLRWLQGRSALPEDGILDKESWNALARLYQLFVVRWDGMQGTDP